MRLPADLVNRLRPLLAGKVVCVTGGAGFIGGHVVDALLAMEARVTVIDDLSNSTAEHLMELIELDPGPLRFVHASILEDAALAEAMAGAEIVFHLGAVGSVPLSVEYPERSFAVNAGGTLRVLQAARKAKVRRVIYSASSSAYGDVPTGPGGGGPGGGGAGLGAPGEEVVAKVESMVPSPLSPYAASKLAGEHAMRAWAKSYGLETVSLRYFNIFGPRQAAGSAYAAAVAAFCRAVLVGEAPTIYGDGRQSRDFTPVANAVAANLLAATTTRTLSGQVVNIGTGQRTDLLTMLGLIAHAAGRGEVAAQFRPARTGEVRHSLADIAAARGLLDYQPIGDIRSAVSETVAWYRSTLTPGGGSGSASAGGGAL
ncbi:MAG: NAD-dependent epimerase/dehydratase family protein [Phycisphaerales bacterium]|jgi:nucleoside-diphosphate-sugar epimerase|nr:NAD-dependent epimerase/dehydratase family protein [Phycisphaerales bacterium]